jgi:hypothetical protein
MDHGGILVHGAGFNVRPQKACPEKGEGYVKESDTYA